MTGGNGDMDRICTAKHEILRQEIRKDIDEAVGGAAVEAARSRHAADRAANEATNAHQEVKYLREDVGELKTIVARLDGRVNKLTVEGAVAGIRAELKSGEVIVAKWKIVAGIVLGVLGIVGTNADKIAAALSALFGG